MRITTLLMAVLLVLGGCAINPEKRGLQVGDFYAQGQEATAPALSTGIGGDTILTTRQVAEARQAEAIQGYRNNQANPDTRTADVKFRCTGVSTNYRKLLKCPPVAGDAQVQQQPAQNGDFRRANSTLVAQFEFVRNGQSLYSLPLNQNFRARADAEDWAFNLAFNRDLPQVPFRTAITIIQQILERETPTADRVEIWQRNDGSGFSIFAPFAKRFPVGADLVATCPAVRARNQSAFGNRFTVVRECRRAGFNRRF